MCDSDDEEDFAVYGTPLDPLDEDSLPRKKPIALEDQVVKDKQGRRRFHGAFTGGFSAGFFNSVGSLEGWTPSTFKSSRSIKADKKTQAPKDFMDDEDMEEHGIAPNVLRATADFSERGKKRERHQHSDGPIPGKPVLQELLQPARDTVGVKLLKQMGWKPGQGVGPRQTGAEKRRSKRELRAAGGRVYGCPLPDFLRPPEDGDGSSSEDGDGDLTFAPDDLEALVCRTKDNCFGLGYVGLDRRPVLCAHINLFEPSFLNMVDKDKKVSISGQAFGVGAFEEEDADIYSREDMSQYDFALEAAAKGGNGGRKQRWSEADRPACIEGFVVAAGPPARKSFFPPPTLPRDFQPVHVPRRSRFEPPAEPPAGDDTRRRGLGRHSLTAQDRSHIIGDAVGPPPTVIPPEPPVEYSSSLTATDAAVNSRFRPFVACPEKQLRYEKFLTLGGAEQKESLSKLQPLSMTEWEREHERMEFEQAARLYRPMTGDMGDRFVSATQADDATNPLASVDRTRSDVDRDVVEAARMRMFGRLTRQRAEWRPASLLCKRFNVPEPGSSGLPSSEPRKRTSKFSVFDFLDAAPPRSPSPPVKEEESEPPPCETLSSRLGPVADTVGADNPAPVKEEPTTLTETEGLDSPDLLGKVDLFKAIFLSSSDDESDQEEEVRSEKSDAEPGRPAASTADVDNTVTSIPVPPARTFNNTLRNTSPPRGIFANLDLDAVNARARDAERPSVKVETVSDVEELSDDMFGPPLPSNLRATSGGATTSHLPYLENKESDGNWVEKLCKHPRKEKHSKKKSHKKDKKVSKHKHIKHKDKHKKKHKR